MSSLLLEEEPTATINPSSSERLRATMAAVRVMFTWFGTRKSLTPDQQSQAADTFGAERLSGSDDGKPKVFRDSAVETLREFFERFRHLNIRSNEQLDELVVQAQRVVRGVEPQALRDNQSLRQHVATQLSTVQATLDGLLVDRPRRNIIRKPQG